jgi:hypothetical protein
VQVAEAKKLLTELMTYGHTEVSHPGLVHEEMDVSPSLYNLIIGARGGEIRHIQNSYKVQVNIPNADSLNAHVVVVGEPPAVRAAKAHIERIIQRATEDKQAAILAEHVYLIDSSQFSDGKVFLSPIIIVPYL